MKKGAYALIFFFWAFLTIITPTLIQWSAAAAKNTTAGKEGIQSEGLIIERKMMKLTQETGLQGARKSPPRLPPPLVTSLSPAPAPKDRRKEEDDVPVVVLLTDQLLSKSRRLFLRGL